MNPSLNNNTVPTIDLPQWLPVLARWNPPSHILMVGAGPAEHALALQQTQARVLAVDFSEPPPSHTHQTDKHRITYCHQLLAATDGPQPLHHFNHAQESGLLSLAALSPFWPNLRLVRTEHCPALSVDSLCASQRFQPDWVWIDCHPAAELLQGAAKALAQAQVVLVRVATRSADAALAAAELPPSDLPTVQTALTAHRFQLAGLQAERNPDWATAVFVRNHASEHAYTRATLTAQIEAQARASTEAAAQAAADLAAERKTHEQAVLALQAQHQQAQHARAQEHSQQVEQLQAQLKVTAAALTKAKTEAAACEKAQQHILLATQNQLKAEQAARANEKAALTHQMVDMAKASEEAAAKASADAAAQNQAHQQALQSAHALHSTALDKLRTELEARGENSSRAMAALGEKADALLKDAADARTGFQCVRNIESAIQKKNEEFTTKIKSSSDELIRVRKYLDSVVRQEVGNAKRQIEAFISLQNYFCDGGLYEINLEKSTWPVSPDFSRYLVELLEFNHYDLVIEFGSGFSTLTMARVILAKSSRPEQAAPIGKLMSFEHLEKYHQQTACDLKRYGLADSVDLYHTPLVASEVAPGETYSFYDCAGPLAAAAAHLPVAQPRLLVVVDGPPAATGALARYPALPVVLAHFPNAHIDFLMDDFVRDDEKQIAAKWQKELTLLSWTFGITEHQFEKGALLLSCRPGGVG